MAIQFSRSTKPFDMTKFEADMSRAIENGNFQLVDWVLPELPTPASSLGASSSGKGASLMIAPMLILPDGLHVYPPPCECPQANNGRPPPHMAICGQEAFCNHYYRSITQQMDPKDMPLRYSQAVTNSEAEEILFNYAQEMKEDIAHLQVCIETHGNTIINRWKKKTRQKRADMLAEALPSMLDGKIPRLLLCGPRNENERPGFLVSYLNVDELKEDPSKLLCLLHIRTAYSPETFAEFDKAQHQRLWETGALKIIYNPNCIIMSGSAYGSLTPWNHDDLAQQHIGGFPRASLVMEAQKTLMAFSRKIVDLILRGVGNSSPSGNSKWPEAPKIRLAGVGSNGSWARFMHAAYYTPPTIDSKRLVELAEIRLAAAEDHLWMLQTDPAYAQLVFNQLVNTSAIQSATFEIQNATRKGQLRPAFYGKLAFSEVYNSFLRRQVWGWIAAECGYISKHYADYQAAILAGEGVPGDFSASFITLHETLMAAIRTECFSFENTVLRTPSFERHVDLENSIKHEAPRARDLGDKDQRPALIDLASLAAFWERDPLHCCIHLIHSYSKGVLMSYQPDLFNFLDSYLASVPQERERITARMNNSLSNLAPLHELFFILDYCQLKTTKEYFLQPFPNRALFRWENTAINPELEASESNRVGLKFLEVLSLKLPRRKDKIWLQQMDSARQALGIVWEETGEALRRILERAEPTKLLKEDIESAIKLFEFGSNPDYLANVQLERDAILDPKRRAQPSLPEYKIPSQPEWEESKSSQLNICTPRAKAKSRPAPTPSDEITANTSQISIGKDDTLETDQQEDQPPAQPTIAVKHEHLNFFQQLFPFPNSNDDPKHFRWPQVVLAFEDAGFTVTPSGGSGYTFSCPNGGGAICFHRPHPDNKVNPILLHGMGRRMNKRFGWSRETFVERVKSE